MSGAVLSQASPGGLSLAPRSLLAALYLPLPWPERAAVQASFPASCLPLPRVLSFGVCERQQGEVQPRHLSALPRAGREPSSLRTLLLTARLGGHEGFPLLAVSLHF